MSSNLEAGCPKPRNELRLRCAARTDSKLRLTAFHACPTVRAKRRVVAAERKAKREEKRERRADRVRWYNAQRGRAPAADAVQLAKQNSQAFFTEQATAKASAAAFARHQRETMDRAVAKLMERKQRAFARAKAPVPFEAMRQAGQVPPFRPAPAWNSIQSVYSEHCTIGEPRRFFSFDSA
mmetsp:Transcript_18530/g.53223  ORF Transcript_18530/g.53223 Transcript_18530/m.53223 type:complete len:181 (-) Transcript_18530:136-678(-)